MDNERRYDPGEIEKMLSAARELFETRRAYREAALDVSTERGDAAARYQKACKRFKKVVPARLRSGWDNYYHI